MIRQSGCNHFLNVLFFDLRQASIKLKYLLLLIVAVCMSSTVMAQCTVSPGTEAIVNGDFEQGNTGFSLDSRYQNAANIQAWKDDYNNPNMQIYNSSNLKNYSGLALASQMDDSYKRLSS